MAGSKPGKKYTMPSPRDATTLIKKIAQTDYDLSYSTHARQQMRDRSITTSDVMHVLKYGMVYLDGFEGEPPGQGFFKHRTECRTPNSGSREVGVVVVPCPTETAMKVVTVMWIDEF